MVQNLHIPRMSTESKRDFFLGLCALLCLTYPSLVLTNVTNKTKNTFKFYMIKGTCKYLVQWALVFVTHWNHLGNLKIILMPTDHPRPFKIESVWGSTWVLLFLKSHSEDLAA